ncbi:MAG: diacylglycerol kinase [Oscillospiraceae bacterium]|nr:diacylglycerol kinase [Oscillospiraceae bacterium]
MIRRFADAFHGIARALRTSISLRIHFSVALFVLLFGLLGRLETWAWAVCFVCFGVTLGTELCNCALEQLADRVSSERDSKIRDCKDMAAGGVLASALCSAAAGLVVFLRRPVLTRIWAALSAAPYGWVALGALLPLSAMFIAGRRMLRK